MMCNKYIMVNGILMSYSINELKEKIVRFYFSIGCCLSGMIDSIDVVKYNDKIKCSYRAIEYDISKEKWDDFPPITSHGSNEFPKNWKEIRKIINEYFSRRGVMI